jgi:hypothetical protein
LPPETAATPRCLHNLQEKHRISPSRGEDAGRTVAL